MQPILQLANGRFLLYRRLGGGGFGDVYEAFDQAEQRMVAIKIFKPHVGVDRVLVEGQLHIRLSEHPDVGDIFHIGFDGPSPYLSLRLLRGGTAADRLIQGHVTIQEAVAWTRAVLAALQHAHDLGILHKDLRAANILFDDLGSVYLCDFGIAEDPVRRQQFPAVYPPHQSPEFLEGKPSSVQTEIWQMGCVLYHLLTGQQPFGPNPTRQDLTEAGPKRSVQALNPQIPDQVARVIRRALRIDPLARFQSAHEMLEAINNCSVRTSWTMVLGPGEAWEATTPEGNLLLRIEVRPRAGPSVTVLRDMGNGARAVFRQGYRTIGEARKAAGELMRNVVKSGQWT
jgi:serine/threonine protein kinase